MFREVGVQQIPAGCACACAAGLPRAESWHSYGCVHGRHHFENKLKRDGLFKNL